MPNDIELECACGKLRGKALSISASSGMRAVCYCSDCQAFARFLGSNSLGGNSLGSNSLGSDALGSAGVLDERGGTDVFQMAPSKVQLTSGTDALACVRLSEKGMHRWYCTECKTPIGNTQGPGLPFVGVIHSFMRVERSGRSRDEVLGPVLAHVNTKSATPGSPLASPALATLRAIARSVKLLAVWWLTGAGVPSPFFDPDTRAPRSVPRVLTPEERAALARAPTRA